MRLIILIISLIAIANCDLNSEKWKKVKSPMESPKYRKILSQMFPQVDFANETLRTGRIAGGSPANFGDFPYQILLLTIDRFGDTFICGGSILTHNFILTAAHCLDDILSVEIYAGVIDRVRGPAVWFVEISDQNNLIIHEQYSATNVANDIAIIRLVNAIKNDPKIAAVALPLKSHVGLVLDGYIGTVSGFGKYNDVAGPSEILRYVNAPIAPNSKCEATYGKINIRDTNLCLDASGGKSSCQGDSGGPLTVDILGTRHLVGVVSFGAKAGCTLNYPVVFTRVSSYLSWIQQKTNIEIR